MGKWRDSCAELATLSGPTSVSQEQSVDDEKGVYQDEYSKGPQALFNEWIGCYRHLRVASANAANTVSSDVHQKQTPSVYPLNSLEPSRFERVYQFGLANLRTVW